MGEFFRGFFKKGDKETRMGRDPFDGKFYSPDLGPEEDIRKEDRERLKSSDDPMGHEKSFRDIDEFSTEDKTGLNKEQTKQEASETHEDIVFNEMDHEKKGVEGSNRKNLDYTKREDLDDYFTAKEKTGQYAKDAKDKKNSAPKLDIMSQKTVDKWDNEEEDNLTDEELLAAKRRRIKEEKYIDKKAWTRRGTGRPEKPLKNQPEVSHEKKRAEAEKRRQKMFDDEERKATEER